MANITVSLHIEDAGAVELSIADDAVDMHLALSEPYIDGGAREYEGAYEVEPAAYEQTLPTAYLKMARDVVVKPIPSNWGMISWDGSSLMVS